MIQSFRLALQNIRSNLFHTLLSVLGIVIGVAALVATFSLIDGLEKFARDQISSQTSVNAVVVDTKINKTINNLSVRKDSFQVIDYEHFAKLKAQSPGIKRASLHNQYTREVQIAGRDSAMGALVQCIAERPPSDTLLVHGQMFEADAFPNRSKVTMVNLGFAELLAGKDSAAAAVGRTVEAMGHTLTIIGVIKNKRNEVPPTLFMPISLLDRAELIKSPPTLLFELEKTEDVPVLKSSITSWIKSEYGAENTDFEIRSQDHWVEQTAQGFLIFRLIMGMIIGISVVVGGVGVMNVLLISVNERTAEIGLRKAVGAKKGDIRRLFLAESITVSAFGSMVGLLLGAGFAMAAIPIIRFFADVPFEAVLTWNTFLIIVVVAIIVGIIFGTYPAVKASRLDPVEALRRE